MFETWPFPWWAWWHLRPLISIAKARLVFQGFGRLVYREYHYRHPRITNRWFGCVPDSLVLVLLTGLSYLPDFFGDVKHVAKHREIHTRMGKPGKICEVFWGRISKVKSRGPTSLVIFPRLWFQASFVYISFDFDFLQVDVYWIAK